jgi:diacylglycerol kinase
MKPPNLPTAHHFSRPSLRQSFRYAVQGLRVLLSTQRNARIHLMLSLGVIALGSWFRLTYTEWALLALAMGLVWVAEGLNTALELLTDLVSPEPHPLAGKAKDVAAGAVLLAAVFAAVVGGCVFLPRIWACWS